MRWLIAAAASLAGEETEIPGLGLCVLPLRWKEPSLHRKEAQKAFPAGVTS